MYSVVRRLLSEKIMDDFYERSFEEGQSDLGERSLSTQNLTERLRALLPKDQHDVGAHFIRRYFSQIRCHRAAARVSTDWHTMKID